MNKKAFFIITILFLSQVIIAQTRCERLFPAVRQNDSLLISNLLDSGANINQTGEYGVTALMIAAFDNDLSMIKFLVKNGAKYDSLKGVIYDEDTYYGSLLAIAAGFGYDDMLKYFVEDLKLDINKKEYSWTAKDYTGWTPLQWTINLENNDLSKYLINHNADVNLASSNGYTPLIIAVLNNLYDMAELLIDKGAEVNFKVPNTNEDYANFSAIHFAAFSDSTSKMLKLLIDNGANVNLQLDDTVEYGGYTPLLFAIITEQYNNFDFLLKNGADINLANADGYSPFLLAIDYELENYAQELISRNADISQVGENEITALHLACQYAFSTKFIQQLIDAGANVNATISDTASSWDNPGFTPLHFVADDIEKYKYAKILLLNDANINAKDAYSITPLHLACKDDLNLALVKLFITNGADVNAKDIDGYTPLQYACMYTEYEDIAKFLIENGANINTLDNAGNTPLINAAKSGNAEIFKYLYKNNADIDLKNDLNQSVWDVQKSNGTTIIFDLVINDDIDMVKLLVKNGANVNAEDTDGYSLLDYAKYFESKKCKKYLKRKGAKYNLL